MKAVVDFDDEADKFLLDLNGEAFESLTYLDPTYCADEAKAVSFGGKIWVNGKLVTDQGFEWSPAVLHHILMQANPNEDPMTKLRIGQMQGTTIVANEALALLS